MNEIKETIYEQLQQLQMLIHRSGFHHIHKMHNPYRGQGRVLALLKLKSEISQKELTYLLGVSKQSAAELIGKLEKSGYITREPSEDDKRVMIVKLTEEGLKAAVDSEDTPADSDRLLDCLSDDELKTFSEYLGRIIKQYEEQFPDEDFEQHRQRMADFMSSYGRGFGHGSGHHHHGQGSFRDFDGHGHHGCGNHGQPRPHSRRGGHRNADDD